MINNIVIISGIARLNNKYTKTPSLLDEIFRPKFDINFRFFKNVSNEGNYNFSTHRAVLHTDGTFGIAGDSYEGASFFTLAYLL